MSAIAGCVDPKGMGAHAIAAMTASLRHRAAAGERHWYLEGAALGAIGRSALRSEREDPAEPLALIDGHVANGPDLAAALGATGPVETLLSLGYSRWGRDLAFRLAGGFAIAIWDPVRRRLLLIRDPMGVKPLYHARVGEALLFGSEPKAIFEDPRFERRLDWSRLDILLQPRLGDSDETPLLGLSQVNPGHVLEFGEKGLREHPYWSLQSRPHEEDYPATVERVRALLDESIAGATRDVEQGVAMLSGGLDSTGVVALAKDKPLDTFCVRFADDGEDFEASALRPDIDAPFAAGAAAWLGRRHHEVNLSMSQLLSALPATRRARDLPGWGQFDASMYCLFGEMARVGHTGLSGEAADELFGGYPFFFDEEVIARDTFPWLGQGLRLADFLTCEARSAIAPGGGEAARYRRLVREAPSLGGEAPEMRRMREIFYLGMKGPLSVVLERKDRMSSAWGLDLRLPYCDHRLIDYVWNIPWAYKSKGGVKGLLKDALRDVLPPATLERRKSAYPHTQSEEYHRTLLEETLCIAAGPHQGARLMFSDEALRDLVTRLGVAGTRQDFPGGADPRYMLVHIVELHRWLLDARIAL